MYLFYPKLAGTNKIPILKHRHISWLKLLFEKKKKLIEAYTSLKMIILTIQMYVIIKTLITQLLFIVRTLKLKKGLFFEFNAPTIRKDEFSIL